MSGWFVYKIRNSQSPFVIMLELVIIVHLIMLKLTVEGGWRKIELSLIYANRSLRAYVDVYSYSYIKYLSCSIAIA